MPRSSADLASARAAFAVLLKQHMEAGTRPAGTRGVGAWNVKDFARRTGVTPKQIENYRAAASLPRDLQSILDVLFGDDPRYAGARANLIATFAGARGVEPPPAAPPASNDPVQPIESIGSKLDQLPAEIVARLMAALDARGTTAAAAESGLARETILKLAKRLRPDEVLTLDQAIIELESAVSIAVDLIQAGARGTNHDAFVDAVLRRVAEKIKADDLDGAARALDDELAAMAEREERLKRDRITLLDHAIQVDILRRDPTAAASRISQIVAAGHPTDPGAGLKSLVERWDHYYEEGEQRGINLSLEIAIAIARLALPSCAGPDERGAWRVRLGLTLAGLGERESGTERLEEAVTAYRAALEENARNRVPLDWAMTQTNLGNALQALGQRESQTDRLEEAVTAYRAALEEYIRGRGPLNWAAAQNNLGNALRNLGERESGIERLEDAVTAFRAALKERTRDRVPLDWAMTQNNLGLALTDLGNRENGTKRLEAAVTAFRASLEEYTRRRAPLRWAVMQNNLGNALSALGQRESGTERLEEAATAYRAALEEHTRDRVPLFWAMTQNNLGIALETLGERESGMVRLEEAVTAYRAALKERTRDRVPLDWATTQNNLGNALSALGERESGTKRLEEAVTAYRAALEERPRNRVPLLWATTQYNLARALTSLGERESGTERLEEAATAYRAALEEHTRERVPLRRANSQAWLDRALALLARRRP